VAPARPKGWGPRYVLDRLEAGEKITRICVLAAKGLPVKWTTLYQEIRSWRAQSLREEHPPGVEKFDEQYQFWLDKNTNGKRRVGGGSWLPVGWSNLWLRTYMECRCNAIETTRRMEEIYGIKVSMRTINEMLNPSHALYNEEFSSQYRDARPLRVELNAAIVYDIIDDPNVDAKTRAQTAVTVNERLDREGWGRSTNVQISGHVDHRLQVEGEMRAYQELVAGRFKALPAKPQELEGEVVDGEVLEEEATG